MLTAAVYFLLVCAAAPAAPAAAVGVEKSPAVERKAQSATSLDMSVLNVGRDSPLAISARRAREQIADLQRQASVNEQNREETTRRIQKVLAGFRMDKERLAYAKRLASQPQGRGPVRAVDAEGSYNELDAKWREATLGVKSGRLKSGRITPEEAERRRGAAWDGYLRSIDVVELRIASEPAEAKKEWSPNEIEHWETCANGVAWIPAPVRVIKIKVSMKGHEDELESNIRLGKRVVELGCYRLKSTPAVLPGGDSGRPEKAGEKAGTAVPATKP